MHRGCHTSGQHAGEASILDEGTTIHEQYLQLIDHQTQLLQAAASLAAMRAVRV
jgi:hypothetical protein